MQNQYVRISQVSKTENDAWLIGLFEKAAELPHHQQRRLNVEKDGNVQSTEIVLALEDFLSLSGDMNVPDAVVWAVSEARNVLHTHDVTRSKRGGRHWEEFVMSQAAKGEPAAIASREVPNNPDAKVFVIRGLTPKP